MKRAEVIASILWVGLGCALCLGSVKLGLGTPSDPESGFLPFATGILLIVISFIQCGKLYLEKGHVQVQAAAWTAAIGKRPAIVVAALTLYGFLLPYLGYLLATFTVMLVLFSLYGRRHAVLAFTGSLLVSVVSYFVFHELLRVQLPAGFLGFGG
jgi:hypothetical protein